MEEKKTEGLLLQTIPYLGSQKILKVLTPREGLISLMAKTKSLQPFTNPFLIAEWVYAVGKKEIHLLKDATLRNDLSTLRETYSVISAAGVIARDLLRSQYPEKQGSGPYLLTVAYFQKLSSQVSLEALIASFRLKLLLHDGLLALQNECMLCGSKAAALTDGESCCKAHMSSYSIPFSEDEWKQLHHLTYTRQFQEIQTIAIEKSLQGRIEQLFFLLTDKR